MSRGIKPMLNKAGYHFMTPFNYLIAVIFGISLAAGQILFKVAANQVGPSGEHLSIIRTLYTLPMISALFVYAIGVVLYTYLLQQVPLSRAYMFSLAASTIVPILAVYLFNEPFNFKYLVGAALVFLGVFISSTS